MEGKCLDFQEERKKKIRPRFVKTGEKKKLGTTHQEKVLSPLVSARSSCSFYMDERGICLNPECDSEPDRSNPLWKIVSEPSQEEDEVKPSEDDNKNKLTVWEEIMMEYEDQRLELENLQNLSKPYEPPLPICSKLSAVQYLEKHIFPVLCPILEETLFKAKEWECLFIQKCRFNGLDYISELLWNRNPMHPKRHGKHLNIFDIPFVIIWLYYNPRPIYPLSWIWTKEEAITVLQTYIRRYLVCKEAGCSEMRQFWKSLKAEEEEEKLKRIKSIELLEILFNEILDKLVADAVFESEWKIYGCRCLVKNSCHCVCKCFKWCRCCNCYKTPNHDKTNCYCSKPL